MAYAYRLGWRSLKTVLAPFRQLSDHEAQVLARDLARAMVKFDITGEREALMFLAQIFHESGGTKWREELASGSAYEGRRDLGNIHAGDGRRFKGRTYIQITGRTNYAAVSRALGHDFLLHPGDLANPRFAALGAAWWWHEHGCHQLAVTGNPGNAFLAVTRRINGGTNGYSPASEVGTRLWWWHRVKQHDKTMVPKRRPPR